MLAIIGGSGLYSLDEDFDVAEQASRKTPYGETSADILIGRWDGVDIGFMPRHGAGHSVPPHAVNYRANLWAMHEAGVRRLIAVNAVGGIGAGMAPGRLVVPQQLIDYSSGREHSYVDGADGKVRHVDFTEPYSAALRQDVVRRLVNVAHDHGLAALRQVHGHGAAHGAQADKTDWGGHSGFSLFR